MISLKVNNRKVKVPTSYEELPYHKAEKLAKVEDTFDIISIVLELTEEEKKKRLDTFSATLVMKCSQYLKEQIPTHPVSGSVIIRGEKVDIKKLDSLPLGAYKDMQLMYDKKDPLEANKWIVAIFLQNEIDGNYDFEKAGYLIKDVERLSCLDVVSISSFFFKKLTGLKTGILTTVSPRIFLRWKIWRVLANWKSMIFLIFYLRYAKILIQIEKQYLKSIQS